MVLSKISNIEYIDTDAIHENDRNIERSTYDIILENIDDKYHTVIFGNVNYDHQNKGYVFFPIYLVNNDEVQKQIGIFECSQDKLNTILDEDGDIDPEHFANPLYYSFVNKPYLDKLETRVDDIVIDESDEGKVDEDELEIENLDEDDVFNVKEGSYVPKPKESFMDTVFESDVKKPLPNLLDEETKADANEIKSKFKASTSNEWIQKFMKNNHYSIIDNEGSGDCLFAVVRDAFSQIGKITTVKKLRSIIADEANEDIFEEYRKVYLEMMNELDEIEKKIKKNETALKTYKKRATTVSSKKDHEEIIERAKFAKDEIIKLKKEKVSQDLFIKENFGYMKTLTNLEKFKEYIKTSQYWADAWTISTLEHKLNFKFIILSEEAYSEDSQDSVLNCGEANTHIEKIGTFKPDHYIITSYSGQHYRTISYKNKKIFSFREIPYDIKNLIINKCMEKNAGIFYLIEDFKKTKENMGINTDHIDNDDDNDYKLYDPSIIFMIHSKSQNKPLPGKGSGEKIKKADMAKFKDLLKYNNWRKKLDDDFIGNPLDIDNKKWASVQHYYQAAKYKKTHPDYYFQFSLDSDSDISKDVKKAKESGSVKGQSKKVSIDPDFYGSRNVQEKENALKVKFEEKEMKEILLLTDNAKIVTFKRGSPPENYVELMNVRKYLKK